MEKSALELLKDYRAIVESASLDESKDFKNGEFVICQFDNGGNGKPDNPCNKPTMMKKWS